MPTLHPRARLAATLTFALLGALQLSGCGSMTNASGADSLERRTNAGVVAGNNSTTTGAYEWLGVPYAKPPVGALRWMPPVAPEAWSGVRPARAFGNSCVQTSRFYSPAPDNAPYGLAVREGFGKAVGSEDCLSLNIWRPATAAQKLPVIVFIHGGSNISGYSADPAYHGATLARKANAVVVTINYRLGLFGWLKLPQLATGDARADSGNFATLDQIQSLRFINANIEAFGGDAGNVTVMGQSAGAFDLWSLLVAPESNGLIHKAVPMSGGLLTAPEATAQAWASNLAAALLLADGSAATPEAAQQWIAARTPAQVAAYVRGKSAEDLVKASTRPGLGIAPAPIADGTVIPADPIAALAAGNYRAIPVLAGTTSEEGKLFGGLAGAYKPNDYDRFGMQYNFNPDGPVTLTEADLLNPAVLPADKPGTGWNAVSANLGSRIIDTASGKSLAALGAKQPGRVWYYVFDWKQAPAPFDTVYGAVHALDVPFMLGNFDGKNIFSFAFSQANRPGREALSDAMIGSLSTFARTGNPNHPGLGTNWPAWPATLVFDATKTQAKIQVK